MGKDERKVRTTRYPLAIDKAIRLRAAKDDAPSFNTEVLWILTGVVPPLQGFTKEDCTGESDADA